MSYGHISTPNIHETSTPNSFCQLSVNRAAQTAGLCTLHHSCTVPGESWQELLLGDFWYHLLREVHAGSVCARPTFYVLRHGGYTKELSAKGWQRLWLHIWAPMGGDDIICLNVLFSPRPSHSCLFGSVTYPLHCLARLEVHRGKTMMKEEKIKTFLQIPILIIIKKIRIADELAFLPLSSEWG